MYTQLYVFRRAMEELLVINVLKNGSKNYYCFLVIYTEWVW